MERKCGRPGCDCQWRNYHKRGKKLPAKETLDGNRKAVRCALAYALADNGVKVTTHDDLRYKEYKAWIVGNGLLEVGENAWNNEYCK